MPTTPAPFDTQPYKDRLAELQALIDAKTKLLVQAQTDEIAHLTAINAANGAAVEMQYWIDKHTVSNPE